MVIQKNDECLSIEEITPTTHNLFLGPGFTYFTDKNDLSNLINTVVEMPEILLIVLFILKFGIWNLKNSIFSFIMDDNELISVCNNLKQLQQVMVQVNSVVEGVTDKSLTERMTDMSYLESAQMHLMMAEISINLFYCCVTLRFVIL